MLNKEKYKDELEEILVSHLAVSKNGRICQCRDIENCKDCLFCCTSGGDKCVEKSMAWLNSECKEHILDEAEKRYLAYVIRPFRDKVRCITKCSNGREWIVIEIINDVKINFPYFEKGSMYRGMELERKYTLEELGL